MQKSIIVKDNDYSVKELNNLLGEGWKVVHTCPMPSSVAIGGDTYHQDKIAPTCLVVVEKRGDE